MAGLSWRTHLALNTRVHSTVPRSTRTARPYTCQWLGDDKIQVLRLLHHFRLCHFLVPGLHLDQLECICVHHLARTS
jgi:hypothetical protein